jgi:hypothetical protein
MVDMLSRPIPGQSLTDTPKNAPWERPSELAETGDVVKHYITRLADEDVMDDLAVAFEMGADMKTVVDTMMTMGAMKGVHTVENGMLAGPTVAVFIKAAMTTYGIDVKETSRNPGDDRKERNLGRLKLMLKEYLGTNPEQDGGTELLEEMSEVETLDETPEETPEEPMVEAEAEPAGLMAKGEV